MKRTKRKEKFCRQSIFLQKKINRQQEVLKEASNTIFNNVGQTLSRAKMDLATTDVQQVDLARKKINISHDIVGKAIIDLRQLGNNIIEVINNEEIHKEDYEPDA
jgi:hypothetical protein